jgi:uncharacterized protein YbcC (UPF0753/DUF2309 family)
MPQQHTDFNENKVLHHLKHFLPSQAPLKDFIHHNTLHAFQNLPFHQALHKASTLFGYKVYLQLEEYRQLYTEGQIKDSLLTRIITENKGAQDLNLWKERLINDQYDTKLPSRVGSFRNQWKAIYKVTLDKKTHPLIFRLLNNYLDQGISINGFPLVQHGFLSSIKEIERNSYVSLFKSERARMLFLNEKLDIESLLNIVVGDPQYFEQYLFDQQFAHIGWSGMASFIEDNPKALLDQREIKLSDLIIFELLLEIDALDSIYGENWRPLGLNITKIPTPLFDTIEYSAFFDVLSIWQEAYEWTYYNEVFTGIKVNTERKVQVPDFEFHALFCIDDRECSIRRHLESISKGVATYGTPGFFNVEFYFQPEHSNFHTKVCPAPLTPGFLVLEKENTQKRSTAAHFTKQTHSLLFGWLISQTLGFWSGLKLFFNIFSPRISPATSYSFRHMDRLAKLNIEYNGEMKDGLQVGFTVEEMANRMEGLFKSIGLIDISTPIVYFVGHGASSINNTHYAGYDCGACSGRPGSVNARVAAFMSNHKEVREILKSKGIIISHETQFLGALHDTTRDEIEFFDIQNLSEKQKHVHEKQKLAFINALDLNAKERSRKFILTNTQAQAKKVHEKIKLRSVRLFEPRPELNHATNAFCIVGRREITRGLFLDRRAFLNSYDYRIDHDGVLLLNILKAVAPVCGGINLEYYFSRTDNNKLGAGSKLPHNVMGLIGVANGTDGDLRTGLPQQMIEVHDPLRLMVLVECPDDKLLEVIKRVPQTYEWFENEWIHLVSFDSDSGKFKRFHNGTFLNLVLEETEIETSKDMMKEFEKTDLNLPVMLLEEQTA